MYMANSRSLPTHDTDVLQEAIQAHYTERLAEGACCSPMNVEIADAPKDIPTFGCGDPNASASLQHGETVLDLGSGAGFDAFRAAEAVGPEGMVLGVDMTPAMLERARSAADGFGYEHVHFLQGRIEALPVPSASVDVVLSNCVVNLSSDVDAVLREAFRVLKPGGRLRISDTFREGQASSADLDAWCACEAGAHDPATFAAQAEAVGFTSVQVDPAPPGTREGDVYGAVLHAHRP